MGECENELYFFYFYSSKKLKNYSPLENCKTVRALWLASKTTKVEQRL